MSNGILLPRENCPLTFDVAASVITHFGCAALKPKLAIVAKQIKNPFHNSNVERRIAIWKGWIKKDFVGVRGHV